MVFKEFGAIIVKSLVFKPDVVILGKNIEIHDAIPLAS